MSLNRRLKLPHFSWLFYHFKSFDFKQHSVIRLIIIFKAITRDCLHQVIALLVIVTNCLVGLYLVTRFVEEAAMMLMEFIDLPLKSFTIITSTMELELHSKKADPLLKAIKSRHFKNCSIKNLIQLSLRFL